MLKCVCLKWKIDGACFIPKEISSFTAEKSFGYWSKRVTEKV